MSKIEELIKELCPNGVEFKKLSELCGTITTGKLNANAMDENGIYPFYTCDENPYKINQYAFDTEAILISGNGSKVGHINYYKGKFNAYQRTYVIYDFLDINVNFLLHYLKGYFKEYILANSRKGSVPYITLPILQNFKIPVPPTEVQREIVHILDDFSLLTAELTAELTARQKQYEYYRDNLFNFSKEINRCSLKDVCYSIKDGMHNLPKNNFDTDGYPILSAQNIINGQIEYNAKRYVNYDIYEKEQKRINIENDDVLLTIVATIGRTAIVKNNKMLLQRSVCVLKPNKKILPKYLKYYLDTNDMQNYMKNNSKGSAQAGLYLQQVSNILIPLPSLDEQERIVNILDRFDKLCNDISSGLPAEIEARKKQYEYYRDKLLDFEEFSKK